MKKVFYQVFTLVSLGFSGMAQSVMNDVIASSGDYFSNGNNFIAWTIGEPVSEIYTSAQNFMTQGFHQSGPGWNPVTVSEISGANSNILVYPNPASYAITVDFGETINKDYLLQLYDVEGKIVFNQHFQANSSTHKIDMKQYRTGIYLLNIYQNKNDIIQTFKINKVN